MSDTKFLNVVQNRVELALSQAIDQCHHTSPALSEAMAYSCLGGGKRIRAALVYAAAHACSNQVSESQLNNLDQLAAAVEAMHAYSLIHDDLPAMDDDGMRRGKPSNHIAFGEATAILAGDALQCLAFELIAGINTETIPANEVLTMMQCLGQAAGAKGMVAGQILDMAAEKQPLSLEQLERLHQHKTGALINASVHLGALSIPCVNDDQLATLHSYGQVVGLAFQVQDDILDIEGNSTTLGKQQGADMARGKSTYPSLIGLDAAKKLTQDLLQQALDHAQTFGTRGEHLVYLANLIVGRTS